MTTERWPGDQVERMTSSPDPEMRVALDREIAGFFGAAPGDEDARRAFETATMTSWARDGGLEMRPVGQMRPGRQD
jgi:hypothetical protein